MLTFRRWVLLVFVILLVLILFGGKNKIDMSRLLRDVQLERRLTASERAIEAVIRELQKTNEAKNKQQDDEIARLRVDKRILEKQIQELRRLSGDVGVWQQLRYQFPYNVRNKFPAYIWQTWKYDMDDEALEDDMRASMETWSSQNSDFVHEVLSDKNAAQLVHHLYMNVPEVVEAYNAMPEPILKADFFRYLILLARGGVYTDSDTEALKPVPNWLPAGVDALTIGLIVGIEADPDRPDWNQWFARRLQFCQWTIQAKAGHPVLRSIVTNITETTLQRKREKTLDLRDVPDRGNVVMEWTGPGIWTDTIFNYLNDATNAGYTKPVTWRDFTGLEQPVVYNDVLILPITSFSPGVDHMGSKPESDPMAYVKHRFNGVWKS